MAALMGKQCHNNKQLWYQPASIDLDSTASEKSVQVLVAIFQISYVAMSRVDQQDPQQTLRPGSSALTPLWDPQVPSIICCPNIIRREALRRWQNKQGLHATYGNLLEVFVKAGHKECAEALCGVLRKKCEQPKALVHECVTHYDCLEAIFRGRGIFLTVESAQLILC